MAVNIGIISETKPGEGRIPLTPTHITDLQGAHPDLHITVQPSRQRSFSDAEFNSVGIRMASSLENENLILGVKEIKAEHITGGQAYLFFSHTLKGQSYNMPLLQHILDVQATLIDYELIADTQNRRLVFFGTHAGMAGVVNSLWAYGQRMRHLGQETPFTKIKQACEYHDLAEIRRVFKELKPELKSWLVDQPAIVVGITGYGNVSQGVQSLLDLLPITAISPQELLSGDLDKYTGQILKVIFKEEDMFELKNGDGPFVLQDYFQNPAEYRSKFYPYLHKMDILINCIFWTTACPRLITLKEIKQHYAEDATLKVVGDITCDIDGSIQFNTGATLSTDPVYVYDVNAGTRTMGFVGDGPLVMAVDTLPAELPRESSQAFGDALMPFVYAMGACDYSKPFEALSLPPEIHKAVIAHQGKLTPKFEYLTRYLKNEN